VLLGVGGAVGGLVTAIVGRERALAAASRLVDPDAAAQFALQLVRLFSGTTVYRFISGAVTSEAVDASDLIAAAVISFAVWGFYKLVRSDRRPTDLCLAIAVPVALGAFYLIAGPEAVAPHFERYAICLIAPCALLLSRGACGGSKQSQHRRLALLGGALVVIALPTTLRWATSSAWR